MKFCGFCGKQIEDGALFCEYCGKEQPLNIETAVILAKAGDNRGFEYLYNETYKDKKYLAIKYVNNEEDAEDVLQDSYIKMMSSINSLEDPKKFSSWFGTIVSNKAKDLRRKKNREDAEGNSRRDIHFSEMESEDSDGDIMEYEFEDDNPNWQPEVAYTQKETQDLVREMMAGLSDEQRMALLMFHIEGMSIKEIAEAMEVSENTVKSRLNYARKNIKTQGEELRKKGYKLYSYAPLPLLLYLIRLEAKLYGANGVAGAGFAYATASSVTTTTNPGAMSGNAAQSVNSVASGNTGGVASASGDASGTAASSGGLFAALSGLSLGVKALIGIFAAAVVVIGTVFSLNLIFNRDNTEEARLNTETSTEQMTDSTEELTEVTTEESSETVTETTTEKATEATSETTEAKTEVTTEATTEVTTEEAKVEYPDDLVVDSAMSRGEVSDMNGTRTATHRIPEINYACNTANEINNDIVGIINDYSGYDYTWWLYGDILNIEFNESALEYDGGNSYMYSVDLKNDQMCDVQYYEKFFDITDEEYMTALQNAASDYIVKFRQDFGNDSIISDSDYQNTLEEKNLHAYVPYITKDGVLCAKGDVKVSAGAGHMTADVELGIIKSDNEMVSDDSDKDKGDKSVKKTQDYNDKVTESFVRYSLNIPDEATIEITFNEKYFRDGIGEDVVPVTVKGTGDYEGYMASGDFPVSGSAAMSVMSWHNN